MIRGDDLNWTKWIGKRWKCDSGRDAPGTMMRPNQMWSWCRTGGFLFSPNTIPSVQTLKSPQLLLGALGNMRFVEKKNTAQPGNPASPSLALSNLVQIPVSPLSRVGGTVLVDCWGKAMGRYKLEVTLVGFESRRLLEIDTEEKIGQIADKLAEFCKQ